MAPLQVRCRHMVIVTDRVVCVCLCVCACVCVCVCALLGVKDMALNILLFDRFWFSALICDRETSKYSTEGKRGGRERKRERERGGERSKRMKDTGCFGLWRVSCIWSFHTHHSLFVFLFFILIHHISPSFHSYTSVSRRFHLSSFLLLHQIPFYSISSLSLALSLLHTLARTLLPSFGGASGAGTAATTLTRKQCKGGRKRKRWHILRNRTGRIITHGHIGLAAFIYLRRTRALSQCVCVCVCGGCLWMNCASLGFTLGRSTNNNTTYILPAKQAPRRPDACV